LIHKTHEIDTFLNESKPVRLISQLDDYRLEGSAVILRCGSVIYTPERHNYYGTVCETVIDPPAPSAPVTVQIDFLTDELVRLRYAPRDAVSDHQTPMVVGQFQEPVVVQTSQTDAGVHFSTASVQVTILREPWKIEIADRSGQRLWSTRPIDIAPLRRPEIQWNPPQQRWLFLHRYAYPWGDCPGEPGTAFASFDLRHDERIYGLGEDFGSLDKRGVYRRLWLQEGFGNASPAAYKQAPFYMSSRGYGLFANTSHAIGFRIAELDHTALSVIVEDTHDLDFFWIYGPNFKEILARYTRITGAPAVPPRWSFGLWMGRITYNTQEQVEGVARELRAHRIPCDVIHIDTGWYEKEWDCDYCFGCENFPDPQAMLQRLRGAGFKVSLWQWPNIMAGSSLFSEGQDKGYFIRRRNGQAYTYPGFMKDASLIDYSNPQAVTWMQEKIRRLLAMGVAAIKVDFGEGAPPDALYHGFPSEAMHNAYPLFYSRAIYEATQAVWGKDQAVIWARAAWAGSQRYPVHWSGDGVARYEDLACVLRSALSFGLSGFPFYSHDVGGFSGIPSPDLYIRWAQMGAFSSHVRCHGEPPREPWEYGEEAEAIFRRYMELRYRLLPYIYSEAVRCGQTSLPLARALVVEYPDDPVAGMISDQYLFGDSILVAPMLDETNRRRVYLPAGVWVDYWSKQSRIGPGWLDVEAPLDLLPLYIRGGRIIPYGPICQYVDEKPLDPLTLELYAPEKKGGYEVIDPRYPNVAIHYSFEGSRFQVETSAAPGTIELVLYGAQQAAAARLGNARLEIETRAPGEQRVRYDGRQQAVIEMDVIESEVNRGSMPHPA
jgi:alpha-D-xyloside xylohydrolase